MCKPYKAEPRTITVAQAATVLGISRTTAYECVRAGSIPSLHLGERIIVPLQTIEAMLEGASRIPDTDDTSDEVVSASPRGVVIARQSNIIDSTAAAASREMPGVTCE